MNRKQLTLLVVLGVLLGGLGYLAWKKQQQPYAESTAHMGDKVLPDLPINDIEQIVITQSNRCKPRHPAKCDHLWVNRQDRIVKAYQYRTGWVTPIGKVLCSSPATQ